MKERCQETTVQPIQLSSSQLHSLFSEVLWSQDRASHLPAPPGSMHTRPKRNDLVSVLEEKCLDTGSVLVCPSSRKVIVPTEQVFLLALGEHGRESHTDRRGGLVHVVCSSRSYFCSCTFLILLVPLSFLSFFLLFSIIPPCEYVVGSEKVGCEHATEKVASSLMCCSLCRHRFKSPHRCLVSCVF